MTMMPERVDVRPKRPAVVFGLTMTALAVIALAWHLSAIAVYNGTVGARSLDDRIAAARTAERLEPWNAHFEWRRVTLEAEKLLAAGEIDAAFWKLEPFAQVVRGDALYRTVYQRTVTLKAPLDARKAHVQHGKEKADGSLDPSDIQR